MFPIRRLTLLLALGIFSVIVGCVPVEQPSSKANQTRVVVISGGACQGPNGPVADGAVSYKCAVPGQNVAGCPRYVCQRCNNGTWGAEYSCQLQ
jgi:hypothetical protein